MAEAEDTLQEEPEVTTMDQLVAEEDTPDTMDTTTTTTALTDTITTEDKVAVVTTIVATAEWFSKIWQLLPLIVFPKL